MISLQKIIAWFLIGLLSFEVTFRVPLILDDVSALESSDHEDIVSLLVEEEIFRKMSADIDTYARRIQNKLPHTRTVILTYARDAHPYLIASANERLYFSGIPEHGTKTQKLVGTILIGHVPLPVVHKGNQDFLSLYPYTDFDEPHFFWNWKTSQYEYLDQKKDDPRPDIWHSVIDPNTGNFETDVTKIRDFFARVYEFDDKKGRYQNVEVNPQVLYMDSVNESRAASKGLLAVYEQIFMPQQEHLLYHRFTREFSQYLYSGFLSLMKTEGSTILPSFRTWVPDPNSTASFLDTASDITTKIFGEELITPFIKVINEKYLGDLNRWAHNTGRYYNGYSDVRVDTIPELITTKDALAGQVIKESNDVLEKLIDSYVDSNLSMDIPVLVSRPGQKTITENQNVGGKIRQVSRTYNFVYDNYFYGTKAGSVTSASQCSLLRGTQFGGKNTTVETNHGYSIAAAQNDTKLITADAAAGIKCSAPTQSYWGGNSPMNATYTDGKMVLKNHRYDDFSLPVLDLSAGNKTTGTNSPLDCLRNDLLLRPYQHSGLDNRRYLWPTETGGARYSCATPLQSPTPVPFSLDPTPETNENILSSLVGCTGKTGNITLLNRDGGSLGLCQANGLSGTYKRISSLVKHSDPTTEIYGKQLQGNTTPNLPIDEERFLLYLDRTGAQSRIDYPNLFDINVGIDDTDEQIVAKIRTALTNVQSRLVPAPAFPSNHRWNQLIKSSTASVNLADILLANTDIRSGLVDALRWKYLDIEMKYSKILETALTPTVANSKMILPDKKDLYEISYLGGQGDARNFVFGFSPESQSDLPEWFTKIQSSHGEIATTLGTFSSSSNPEYSLSDSEIATLLGESDTQSASSDGGSSGSEGTDASVDSSDASGSDDECGDPTGVVIWEWLSAIQCWLSNLMKTEWFTPDIDDLGFPDMPSLTVNFGGNIVWSTKDLQDVDQADTNNNDITDYVEKNKNSLTLKNTLSSTTIEPTQTLRIDTALENTTNRIDDDVTKIKLEVIRIDDLDDNKSYSARDTGWTEIQNRYFSVSGGNTLRDGHAVWIFSSRNNHRARVTFESRIYSGTNVLIRSEKDSVLIGPINLGVTVLGSSGSKTSETITAGDPSGIQILLSGLDIYSPTADITLRDYITGEEKGTYKAVPITQGKIRLGSPTIDTVIQHAGRYTMTVLAGDYSGKTNFTISTSVPHHITAKLDPLLIKDTPVQMSLTLEDSWGNTINTQDWNVQVESSANIILAPLSTKTSRSMSGKFVSSLTLTPIESGNTTLTLTAFKGSEKISTTLSRPVLSDAHIAVDIPNRSTLEVGQGVPVNFSIQRQDGTVIEDWEMSVKIGIRGGDAAFTNDILTFSKGRATTTLKTGKRTGTAVIYLGDTGLGKIIGDSFTISPGVPTSLTLTSPELFYAKIGARDILKIHLYDAYGNLTTLHGYVLRISPDKPALLENISGAREISTGTYETDIISRGYPGRILFRAWLEKDGVKSGLATLENVSQTNAFPVITSEQAEKNSWQNITQVLLGAAFGQSPVQGYFGGATLFAAATKTLALSTLIDTPEEPLLTVTPSGNILTGNIQYGTGVEVQVESYNNGALSLIVYDTRLGGIARIKYPIMSNDRGTVPCSTSCDRDLLYFTSARSDIIYRDGVVYNGTQKLFSLSEIFTFPNLSFAFVHQKGENLQFSVSYNGQALGTLSLRWKSRVPSEKLGTDTPDTFIVESLKSTILTRLAWTDKSSYETPALVLYNSGGDSNQVGGPNDEGWSAYPKKYGLGWTEENTGLLQFASGGEWSQSLKESADYLTINLGDPIVSLPNYQVNATTGLDQALGDPVYVGTTDIDDFIFKDANSDGKKDLIAYHADGTVGMALSRGDGAMLDIGDLLSVRAAEKGMVRAGDFIGDGYADVVYVDEKGILHQVTHDVNGPTEKPMKYNETPLLGQIEQLEVFDVDHDGIDDIIVMDHIGSLYIFYGQTSGEFVVQLIENVYDFILSDEAKTSYFTGAISYTGLGFTDPDNIPKAATFELQSKQDQVNQLLFTQIHLAKTTPTTATPETLGTSVVNSLNVDSNGFLRMYDGDATTVTNSLQFGYDTLGSSAGESITVSQGDTQYDTYDLLKAPFVSPGNVLITKQYRSLEESGQIIAGSPIEVKITLKNASSKNVGNILLLEKFAEYLTVSDMSYDLIRDTKKETRNFLADSSQQNAGVADLRDIVIAPGASISLIYTGELRSFSFGRFDVGYLEDRDDPIGSGSLPQDKVRTINTTAQKLPTIPEKDFYNHDEYGDIRFNPNETCGGPLLLWRSHNTYDRTYSKAIISRQLEDPKKNAVELGNDPTKATSSVSATAQASTANPTLARQVADETIQKQTSFASGLSWDYRIGSVPSIGDRDVYMVDLFATSSAQIAQFKNAGKKVVCYINAGALQSGSHGQGLSNADTVSGGAQFQKDWDEKFLDIRSARVRSVMKQRLDLAVTKGCQGIEPDNIDAYDNDTSLTQNDTLDYMKFLSQESHQRGLSLGLKNASNIASRLEPFTDFVITEQCHEYGECSSYNSFANSGKAIFAVEYNNSCSNGPNGFSNISCNLDLNSQCKSCGSSASAGGNNSDNNDSDNNGDNDSGGDNDSEDDISDIQSDSEDALAEWQADGDADGIPDKDDDDSGDVFEVSTSGNQTKISIGLGKIDDVIDEIADGVKEVISGLSCGFGDAGCISMPINWAANIPGNTVTALGYAIPGANQPPYACHKDVRCGFPVFSYPTICSETGYPTCTWPSEPIGAGGAFDYYGGSAAVGGNGLNDGVGAGGSVAAKAPGTYMPGVGISEFRLFIGATLTGAIAEVLCFGPNNAISNVPGLFPLRFDGNCIFATQPLTQCEDDGSSDEPLDEELDVSDELSDDGDDGNEGNDDANRFTNADECGYFEPIDSYPTDLSQSAAAYLGQPNDTTVSNLQADISDNADVVNDSGSTDTALGFSTSSPSSEYERLNGQNGLDYTKAGGGTGMIQIALDPSAMKFKDFGKVLDIQLKSIKGFPNFIMDWYQRQMDEIMSSLTHLPGLKIFLPDLTGLADGGLISEFGTGLKDKLGNIVGANPNDPGSGLGPNGTSQNGFFGNNGDLSSEQSSAITRADGIPGTIKSLSGTGVDVLHCAEYANNYLEGMGISSRPIHSSYQDKYNSINSSTPSPGSIAIMYTGDDFGHAAVVTGVSGNSVSVREANGYSRYATGPQNNSYQTSQIAGYYNPSLDSSSRSSQNISIGGSSNSSGNSTGSAGGNIINSAANTVQSGWNGAFSGINSGLNGLSSGVGNVLGGVEKAADGVTSFVQQKTAGIQNAFEYLGTLPIIDVHPETISFDIPWAGKQEAQAWIARNQAILDDWKNLPSDAVNSVSVGPMIASIESNIETVRSYFELPEKLQNLFYLKEKLLYGIIQNVKAIQDLMGGWLYENGQRFKGWVEAFILITKLFDLWQVLIDVFNDYEVQCGECRNERWNLQHWLWIVISAIIPPIPVIEMPRWPDIELDFSDIDLSLDIAYPVFDLNFYPIALPDAPAPTISGFALNGMPQLPQLPDLNIDINIPVIQLPKLPDLPPPPKIPELSQAIEVVLKIFKIITLIQCLYRKIPLSPEWVVGTKVAHKTERQGYLPFDFLDSRLPSVSMEWLEAIRVSSHVKLEYDVDFVIDALKESLEPFNNFPKNIGQSSGSNTVDFNINPDSGVEVQASAFSQPKESIADIPKLIGDLLLATTHPIEVDPSVALDSISRVVQNLDLSPQRKQQFTALLEKPYVGNTDFSHIQDKLDDRFGQIAQAANMDVADNKKILQDIIAWNNGEKAPENIPYIATRIAGSAHLAQSEVASQSKLLALAPSLLRPSVLSRITPKILAPTVAPIAVAPAPQVVQAPGTANEYKNMVAAQGLSKTQGLYVSHGATTHRLIDYTENLDGKTKIHTIDDDGDGDSEVYYTIRNTIYRKENHEKRPALYTIKDAPRVYDTNDIYEDFFGIGNSKLSLVPSEGQVDILKANTVGRIRYRTLMKNEGGHSRLELFRSLFQTQPNTARYQVDIIPENKKNTSGITLQSVPRIVDIDGLAFIERNKIYRTLITGQKFINEEGKEEPLSADFVIRGGQSGYTKQSTVLEVIRGSKKTEQKMTAGQRIIFDSDSRVRVRKGSLILFGNTTEKRTLTIRDTNMPLLPGDLIITDKNGGATVQFPDGSQSEIGASQHWTLTEYVAGIGIKQLSLPVEQEWYYGTIMDARSLSDNRLPHGTVFDAYTDLSQSDTVSQIPRQITLALPGPTEIDFQTYFPADTLTNVEIFKIPSSEWRRISSTKIAFESQKESREIFVRVSTSGRVRDYTTRLVTVPPKLYIDTVDAGGVLTGKVSSSTSTLPMGIQSYVDDQSWTLATGFSSRVDNTFISSVVRDSMKLSLNQGPVSLATFDRSTGTPTLSAGITTVPRVMLGKTLGYSLHDTIGERIQVDYQSQSILFRQVATQEEITSRGLFVVGSGLRLEPATVNDVNLKGGAYVTDVTYRPVITFDSSGVIRTLDTNISWTVKVENNRVVFTLSRDRQELGKIILAGETITTWAK